MPTATRADITYAAADERARTARSAGLQAKRDEQPKNTMRSYVSKQKQWREWCLTQRPGSDGVLSAWPDGELVTPDKLAAWLSEDLLLRRVTVGGRRPAKHPAHSADAGPAGPGESSLSKAEALAETLHVPLAEAVQILCDDQADYEPPEDVDAEEGAPLTRATLDAYIAAVMELWRLQVAHGGRNLENPRSSAVRGFLEQRSRQRSRIDRTAFRDRGSQGIQAGYSTAEWSAIQKHLLSTSATLPQNFRTRLDLLLGHYYLLRGENRRKMELADLSLLEYPLTEGPTPCGCLVALLQDGKMNKTAKKEFMGALRHRNPLLCTQGALAQLLFWRWHIAGEPAPTFRRRQDWYKIKVLVGSDRLQELSYRTQLEETWRVFGAVGLTAEKTHLPRRAGAQEAETHGTSLTQISQAGRWNASILCKAYLTHLPRQFMRIVAGFSGTAGDYFLTRAVHEPPATLQRQLWPWIEAWEHRFEARTRRKQWCEGGLDDDDLAGDGFLKLMRRLRVVLLQDLAALQPQFPTLPFFSHAPFRGPDWAAFAKSVQASIDDPEEPASLLVKRALPELYSLVESTRSAILQNTHQLHSRLSSELASQLARQQEQLDRLLNTKIVMTGYLGSGIVVPATGLAPEPTSWPQNPLAWPATAPSPTADPIAAASGIPIVSCLPKVFTVADVWREWKTGMAGGPAIESLEEQYGHRWRPGNTMTVQFCRRKVVWDALKALIARGRSEEEAIRELEALRNGQSLNRLVDLLRQRRQRQRHKNKM